MGFPQGGDNLSITSGVVSRIELTNYVHGAAQLLAIQVSKSCAPPLCAYDTFLTGSLPGDACGPLPRAPRPLLSSATHRFEPDIPLTFTGAFFQHEAHILSTLITRNYVKQRILSS
jgi:hypothetical protein